MNAHPDLSFFAPVIQLVYFADCYTNHLQTSAVLLTSKRISMVCFVMHWICSDKPLHPQHWQRQTTQVVEGEQSSKAFVIPITHVATFKPMSSFDRSPTTNRSAALSATLAPPQWSKKDSTFVSSHLDEISSSLITEEERH
jgi:hypothetical protein